MLLGFGASADAQDNLGRVAPHYAVQSGSLAVVQLAVKDPAVRDKNGTTVLQVALLAGHAEIIEYLIGMPQVSSGSDNQNASLVHYAAASKTLPVDLFRKHFGGKRADVLGTDDKANTALHYACYSGNVEVARYLLEVEMTPMSGNLAACAPIHCAAMSGSLECLKLCALQQQQGSTPRGALADTVPPPQRVLLDTPLHKAAFFGHTRIVQHLLATATADPDVAATALLVNQVGSGGQTPLHKAAFCGHEEVVTTLLAHGANILALDAEKCIPLHKAAKSGNLAVFRACLGPPDQMQLRLLTHLDLENGNPLRVAVVASHWEVVKWIISNCRKEWLSELVLTVDSCNQNQVLHYAARNPNLPPKIAELLLLSGADLIALNGDGRSATELAQAANNEGFLRGVEISKFSSAGKTLSPNAEIISRGISLFNSKPAKGIQFLVQQKIIEDNPDSIAQFLFEHDALSKKKIGELLSESDASSQDLTSAFLKQLDFENKDFDTCVRLFLSKFMLPGEAQKIDRVMEMFAQRYYSQNHGSFFANADTCYVLAFAVIMLNTDLHNPAIKKEKKMSKAQWQQHVRGINDGKDLPTDFVLETYENIRLNEIKMESETNMFAGAGKKGFCLKQGGKIRTWKKRYFVLSEHQLLYFKKPTDLTPLGIIPLENLVVEHEEKLVRFGFKLSSADGGHIKAVRMMGGDIRAGNHTSYVIGAPSAEDCNEWVDLIQQNIHRSPFYALLLKKKKTVSK